MKHVRTVVIVAALIWINAAYATVWYVHPDSAMNCIQDCLDSCSTGDTVLVGPGIYSEHIVWPNTQGIDLTTEYGVDMTYLDGGGTDRVLSITTVVDTTTKISGFTIQQGYAEYGAGILCANGASPLIAGNSISLNTSFGDGGAGICIYNASPMIIDNTIDQNSASNGAGGGIVVHTNSSPLIVNNTVTNNTCDLGGGGILSFVGCSPTICSNYVYGNSAYSGGGLCFQTTTASVINNTITGNNATRGGGMYFTQYDTSIVTGNIIDSNTASMGGGISCKTFSAPVITCCAIKNNNYDGVYCWDNGTPLINNNDIEDNIGCGVRNVSYIMINAENNWWNDSTGPYHSTLNPGGQGDSVSGYVDFDPWLTSPGIGEYTTSSPLTLNLQVSPNPCRSAAIIRYSILDTRYSMQNPTLSIYDAAGRLVKFFNLGSSIQNQESAVVWDGTDQASRKLPAGTYFCRITVGDHGLMQKVVLVE